MDWDGQMLGARGLGTELQGLDSGVVIEKKKCQCLLCLPIIKSRVMLVVCTISPEALMDAKKGLQATAL